ncbi:MAG: hypothetical protein JJT78_05815 [Leptospira sp.]|nr:hypothetical protein [Leptospira sp.]
MKSLFVVILLILSSSVYSEEFRSGNFKFKKDLKLNSPISNLNEQWGQVELDEEVYRDSYYNDLRLIYKGESLPYKRSPKYERIGQKGSVKPKVIFEKDEEKRKIYLLEIPFIPTNRIMESIGINSDLNYEAQVQIYFGNEVDNWIESQSSFLYKYNAKDFSSYQQLNLKTKYYRYIRLELDSNVNLDFVTLNYGTEEKRSELEFSLDVPTANKDGDLKAMVYYFPNEKSYPFRSVELQFEEENYKRRYEISFLSNQKDYIYLTSGILHKDINKKINQNSIYVNETQTRPWKLTIFNEDNPPITLKEAKIKHPKEVLEFSTTDMDPKSIETNLSLYYGYKYSSSVQFDLTSFSQNDNQKYNIFLLKEQEDNPDFSYSILHPPFSIWVIRFVFLVGVAGVGFLSFRVFRRWNQVLIQKISS